MSHLQLRLITTAVKWMVTSTKFIYFPLQSVKAKAKVSSSLVDKRHSQGSHMMTQVRERIPWEMTTCAGSTKPAQAP